MLTDGMRRGSYAQCMHLHLNFIHTVISVQPVPKAQTADILYCVRCKTCKQRHFLTPRYLSAPLGSTVNHAS